MEDDRMKTETVSIRFERNVDRTGEHHIWTGAADAVRGTGRVKIGGKNLTAQRRSASGRYLCVT